MAFLSTSQRTALEEIYQAVKALPDDHFGPPEYKQDAEQWLTQVEAWNDCEGIEKIEKRVGLKNYDTAIPQIWCDAVYAATGRWPAGLIVWSYDRVSIFGEPVAVCPDGEALLKTWEGLHQSERERFQQESKMRYFAQQN